MAQASLTSDKEDYPPGSVVTLTGSGFQPGEAVRMQVTHKNEDGDNSSSGAHAPWTVDADENGNFVTTWNVPADEDELNATLLATADGQLSGTHAETTFTDANWTIGPAYLNLCGGIETELTYTITQTSVPTTASPFQNGRFTVRFPSTGILSSASLISVSGGKNWAISFGPSPLPAVGVDVCLKANTSADALLNNETIVFKLLVIPPNTIGISNLTGVSAVWGANCISSLPGTTTVTGSPLRILGVSSLSPVFTQCPSDIAVNTDPGLCSAVVNYDALVTGTNVAMSYAFTGATTGSGSGTGSDAAFNKGTTQVTVSATSCATKTCRFDVTVTDNELPTVTCPVDITLSACQSTATWDTPLANDNCPCALIEQTGGPVSGSIFDNGTATTITYTVTDASNNIQTCSFTVSRAEALTASCTNTNPQLYFGYAGDQTSTIKVTPSGGAGPYTISISMNRPLNCNVITSAGDEVWTGGAGTTSSSGTICPSSGPGVVPVSEATGVTTFYSVNVSLMEDADITATVTDANGCVITCTSHISAEDVRCFAGNSGNTKITVCHRTGSAKNPCVTICIDESALDAHFAHGDFVGKCSPDCVAPPAISGATSTVQKESGALTLAGKLKIKVMPNPTTTEFSLLLESGSREAVTIIVSDLYGKQVYQTKGSIDQKYIFGAGFNSGTYFIRVIQGKQIQTLKVIKGKG